MWSDLPVGAIVVMMHRGEQELYQIVANVAKPRPRYPDMGPLAYTGVGRPLEVGEVVYRVVWKAGDRLESRRAYTLKAGDFEWVSLGMVGLNGKELFTNRLLRKI